MIRKSDLVREYVKQGNYKKALQIAKDFRLGITKEQSNEMKLAYECIVHERFYQAIVKVPESIEAGIETLLKLYGEGNGNDIHEQVFKQRTCIG